ncbi:MAG: hypothetical protein R3F14_35555, partial [Polyangiaceae bacterium]
SPSFLVALEKVLGRQNGLVARLARTGAMASVLAMSAGPVVAGCQTAIDSEDPDDLGETEDAIIGGGQTDWAQQQGQRNTAMVSYYHENWWAFTDCGSRFGCQGIELFLKLRVKPVAGANLDNKHVGVVYRKTGTSALTTVNGTYFTTWGNGDEEWHIKVNLRSWENIISFNAWYQDGVGNTFFDDNSGELHAVAVGGSYPAITHMWGYTNVAVTATGVSGDISVRLADIDYDKDVAMVWTTDDWQTTNWMDMGNGSNQWHWIEDNGDDYERWGVSVDIPGDFTKFEYAIVYRHGVVNGAALYEFWDSNNGSNWVVVRQ